MIEGFIFIIVCEPERDQMPPYAKKGKSYTPYAGTLVVRRGGGGMRKERESARSRARGDEKAWVERDRDDSFVAAVYHRGAINS